MTVYLLHFTSRINPARPCQHYIGSAENLDDRLAAHRRGQGARLCAVALERNIGFELARIWSADRAFERKLKKQKNGRRLCPICNKENKE